MSDLNDGQKRWYNKRYLTLGEDMLRLTRRPMETGYTEIDSI